MNSCKRSCISRLLAFTLFFALIFSILAIRIIAEGEDVDLSDVRPVPRPDDTPVTNGDPGEGPLDRIEGDNNRRLLEDKGLSNEDTKGLRLEERDGNIRLTGGDNGGEFAGLNIGSGQSIEVTVNEDGSFVFNTEGEMISISNEEFKAEGAEALSDEISVNGVLGIDKDGQLFVPRGSEDAEIKIGENTFKIRNMGEDDEDKDLRILFGLERNPVFWREYTGEKGVNAINFGEDYISGSRVMNAEIEAMGQLIQIGDTPSGFSVSTRGAGYYADEHSLIKVEYGECTINNLWKIETGVGVYTFEEIEDAQDDEERPIYNVFVNPGNRVIYCGKEKGYRLDRELSERPVIEEQTPDERDDERPTTMTPEKIYSHVVQSGESLWYYYVRSGLREEGTSFDDYINAVMELNKDIEDPNLIYAGQTLKLPNELPKEKVVVEEAEDLKELSSLEFWRSYFSYQEKVRFDDQRQRLEQAIEEEEEEEQQPGPGIDTVPEPGPRITDTKPEEKYNQLSEELRVFIEDEGGVSWKAFVGIYIPQITLQDFELLKKFYESENYPPERIRTYNDEMPSRLFPRVRGDLVYISNRYENILESAFDKESIGDLTNHEKTALVSYAVEVNEKIRN